MTPVDRVAAMRRKPTACLYCDAMPDTQEHIVPKAVGGRLQASILCAKHNNALSATDGLFAKEYNVLTFAASVPRHDGKVGTSVRFVDGQGRHVTVDPDGKSKFGLSTEKNEAGVIQRASGPEEQLRLIGKAHPDPKGFVVFPIAGPGVTIPVEVGIGPNSLPGYLKTALHFAAGFIGEPSPATIAIVRPGIFLERSVRILRQLPFRAPFFEPSGPVRHEVTIYPDGRDSIVTIMLFSSFCVTLELPQFTAPRAVRYLQLLDGTGPNLIEFEAVPVPDAALSGIELDHLLKTSAANVQRIFEDRAQRDIEEIASEAARNALGFAFKGGDLIPTFMKYFKANLNKVPLSEDIVDVLSRQALTHLAAGRIPFDTSSISLK